MFFLLIFSFSHFLTISLSHHLTYYTCDTYYGTILIFVILSSSPCLDVLGRYAVKDENAKYRNSTVASVASVASEVSDKKRNSQVINQRPSRD